MTLASYQVPRETIKAKGGEITVRGLSLNDILLLLDGDRAQMEHLFEKFQAEGDELLADEQAVLRMLLKEAPKLFAKAVALAADEPEAENVVVQLPLAIQVQLVDAIGRLTFDAEGGPKKVLEIVVKVLQGWTTSLESLQA